MYMPQKLAMSLARGLAEIPLSAVQLGGRVRLHGCAAPQRGHSLLLLLSEPQVPVVVLLVDLLNDQSGVDCGDNGCQAI